MARAMVIRDIHTGEIVHQNEIREGVNEEKLERGMAMRVDMSRFTFGIEEVV